MLNEIEENIWDEINDVNKSITIDDVTIKAENPPIIIWMDK